MILFKKAMRSIWRNKKAYIACIALMGIGIAIFVSFNMLYLNLLDARESFYREQRFADVFAAVKSIPLADARALEKLEGVRQMDATIVVDSRVDSLASDRIITLRLNSFDPEETDPLNAFLIVEGAAPAVGEILVNDVFAEANGLQVGDAVTLVVAGRTVSPVISGMVQSPEYVYAIPDASRMFPDNEAFGFGYMRAGELGAFTGKTGAATNIAIQLEDGYVYDDVKAQIEDSLNPYGMLALYERKDQISEAMIDQEISSIGAMASSIPMVFILMAVIILYIMLKRVIEQERSQIGTLKALGYSDWEIILHYMGYGGITGFVGGALGAVCGVLLTGMMTDLYLEYFNLPAFGSSYDYTYIWIGFAISVGSGMLGSYMGTRGILRLTPSEAMRPPAPPVVKSDLVGKLPFLRVILSSYGYMAMRNITRNKFRSAFVVCGVAFSFSIMAFMASYGDMFDAMLLNQFTKVQLYDMKLTLEEPRAYTPSIEAAYTLTSVAEAEGMLEVPVEMRLGHLKESVVLTAMQPQSHLYNIYDNISGEVLEPPSGGVILSDSLASKLNAKRGDLLTVRTSYTEDDDLPLPVLGIVNENLGLTAYTDLDSLCALLDVPRSLNSVILRAPDTVAIKEQLLDADNIAVMMDKEETLDMYTEMVDSYAFMLYMMQLAGIGIAFAIITNTSAISLSERSREYATMRVLGMHPREVGQVVSFEYWLLTILGILPGIPLTRLIKVALAGTMDNDLFSMPLETSLQSFVSAAVGCVIAVAVSNRSAVRKISRFDMVDVLKERE